MLIRESWRLFTGAVVVAVGTLSPVGVVALLLYALSVPVTSTAVVLVVPPSGRNAHH